MSSIPSSLQNLDPATLERFRAIVKTQPKFDSPPEQTVCEQVVDCLSSEELDATACISYAYWALKSLGDETITLPEVTRQSAMKIARWHVQYIGPPYNTNNVTKAVKRLQEALSVRKEQKLDLFRICFDTPVAAGDSGNDASLEQDIQSIKSDIQYDLEKQLQVLLGRDKAGRAVLIKVPRTQGGTTEQAYVRQQLYAAERSAAVTEFVSQGEHDTVCAVFSMQNQSSKVTPSLSWQLTAIKLLQAVYPGRMAKVFVLEAPFLIRQIFNGIKPFLSSSLKESTFLVTGKAKTDLLNEALVDPNILTEDGTLVTLVDQQKYLTQVPFYSPYDSSL